MGKLIDADELIKHLAFWQKTEMPNPGHANYRLMYEGEIIRSKMLARFIETVADRPTVSTTDELEDLKGQVAVLKSSSDAAVQYIHDLLEYGRRCPTCLLYGNSGPVDENNPCVKCFDVSNWEPKY